MALRTGTPVVSKPCAALNCHAGTKNMIQEQTSNKLHEIRNAQNTQCARLERSK